MKYIRQGATHKVVLGPAVAVGDGFTPVTTLALNAADEAEAILHDNGTVVDISGYTFAAIATADGYYHLTLQSGISNTVGHLTIVVNDDSLILPLRADFTVIEEAIYDALFAASANAWSGAAGSSIGVANVTQLGGDAQSATDLKDFADAGYDPSTNKVQGVVLVDTLTTYTGNTPQTSDHTANIAAILVDTGTTLDGKLDAIDNLIDTEVAALQTDVTSILADTNELQTDWANGGRLDLLLDGAKENTDYPDGYVYFSSFYGTAGSTLGTNGTWRNPVSVWADALSLANTIGGIKFTPKSAANVTTGTLANRNIDLNAGALTVGTGVSMAGTRVYSSTQRGNLYGTSLAAVEVTTSTVLQNLYVSGLVALGPGVTVIDCGIAGNVTDSTGGPNASSRPMLENCYNFKGDGSAVTFNLLNGGHWHLLGWYGDLTITNMAAGQVFYANGWGKLTIAASCTGGTLRYTSHIKVTDNSGGAVTKDFVSEPTPWNSDWDAEVESEVTDALTAYDPPTNAQLEARTLVAADYFDPATDTVANVTTVGSVTTKTGYALTSAYDLYHADINLSVDEANTQDEYTVTWFKNGARITSGVTAPTIQVVKRADGTDLVASTSLTEIGSTESFKYDEDTNRITGGEAVLVIVAATIDAGSRAFSKLISRDSTA